MKKVVSFIVVFSILVCSCIPVFAGRGSGGLIQNVADAQYNAPANMTNDYVTTILAQSDTVLFNLINDSLVYKRSFANVDNSHFLDLLFELVSTPQGFNVLRRMLYSNSDGMYTYDQIVFMFLFYCGRGTNGRIYTSNGNTVYNELMRLYKTVDNTSLISIDEVLSSYYISNVLHLNYKNIMSFRFLTAAHEYFEQAKNFFADFLRASAPNFIEGAIISNMLERVDTNLDLPMLTWDSRVFVHGGLNYGSYTDVVRIINVNNDATVIHNLTNSNGNTLTDNNDDDDTSDPDGSLPIERPVYVNPDPNPPQITVGDDSYPVYSYTSGDTYNFSIESFVDGSASTIIENVAAGGDLYYSPENRAYTYLTYTNDSHDEINYIWNITNNYTYTYINYYMPDQDNAIGAAYQLYFELPDGRSSAELTVDEIKGMVSGFDVVNYEEYSEDPYQQALYHFDGTVDNDGAFNPFFNLKTPYNFTDNTQLITASNSNNWVYKYLDLPAGYYSLNLRNLYSGSWTGRNGGRFGCTVSVNDTTLFNRSNTSDSLTTEEAASINDFIENVTFNLSQPATVTVGIRVGIGGYSTLRVECYSVYYRLFNSQRFNSAFSGNPVSFKSSVSNYPISKISLNVNSNNTIITNVSIYHAGVNLLPLNTFNSSNNGLTISGSAGGVTFNGNYLPANQGNRWLTISQHILLPKGTYYFYNFSNSGNTSFGLSLRNNSNISIAVLNAPHQSITFTLDETTDVYLRAFGLYNTTASGINYLPVLSAFPIDQFYPANGITSYNIDLTDLSIGPFIEGEIDLNQGLVINPYDATADIDPVNIQALNGYNTIWSDLSNSSLDIVFQSEDFEDYSGFEFVSGAQYQFVNTGDDNYKGSLFLDGLSHKFNINLNEGALSSGLDWTYTVRYYQELSTSTETNTLYIGGVNSAPCQLQYNGSSFTQLIFNGTTQALNTTIPYGTWNTITLVKTGNSLLFFLNGILITTVVGSNSYIGYKDVISWSFALDNLIKYIDEIMFADVSLYTSNHVPRLVPYDSGSVLVVPSIVAENTIAVHTDIPINNYRIGGVRPTFPNYGDCYIHLTNYQIDSIQVWNGYLWLECSGMVYYGGHWYSLEGFNFVTYGEAFDGSDYHFIDISDPSTALPAYHSGTIGNNSFLDSIYQLLYTFFAGALTIIKDLFSLLLSLVKSFFDFLGTLLNGLISGVQSIFQFISPISGIFYNLINPFMDSNSNLAPVGSFITAGFSVVILAAFMKLFL